MQELGDFRWLAVGPAGQDDFSIALLAIPGPPVMDEDTKKQVEELMAKGFAGSVFLTTDDVQAAYEELKGRGVEFTEAPVRASLRDRLRVSRPLRQHDPARQADGHLISSEAAGGSRARRSARRSARAPAAR